MRGCCVNFCEAISDLCHPVRCVIDQNELEIVGSHSSSKSSPQTPLSYRSQRSDRDKILSSTTNKNSSRFLTSCRTHATTLEHTYRQMSSSRLLNRPPSNRRVHILNRTESGSAVCKEESKLLKNYRNETATTATTLGDLLGRESRRNSNAGVQWSSRIDSSKIAT